MPKGHFVSYLKVRKLVCNGLIYHIVLVNDVSVEVPSLHSIAIFSEFPLVFPNDLHGVPPEREIDFSIDSIPDTRPI